MSTTSFTLPVVFESALWFLLFQQIDNSRLAPFSKWLVAISTATLGVFLMHPLVLEHLMPDAIWSLAPFARVVLVWGYVYVLSLVASLLLSRIRFVRKWLLSI